MEVTCGIYTQVASCIYTDCLKSKPADTPEDDPLSKEEETLPHSLLEEIRL